MADGQPDKLDRLINWATSVFSQGTREDLIASIEQADEALLVPQIVNELVGGGVDVEGLRGALGKVKSGLESIKSLESDYFALRKIHKAIKVLKDTQVLYKNPKAGVAAFDDLFAGLGNFAEKLPPPANEFGKLISECGANRFFTKMNNTMFGVGSNFHEAARIRDSND